MKRVFLTLLALIFFTNIFAQTKGAVNLSASWTNASGSQSSTLYAYIPTSYNESNTYSLIIGFPGQGYSYQEWGQSSLSSYGELREYMDSYYGNVIVVSPVAPSFPNSVSGPYGNDNLDYGIIEAVTQRMSDDYNIGDVYVQGFSVGGRIAVHQAIHSADNVKGLIAHSPAVCDETIEFANASGLLACTAANDQTGSNPNWGEKMLTPGCYPDPNDYSQTFWGRANYVKDNINSNGGDAIYVVNPYVGHASSAQAEVKQCWDHVSQFVSTTDPIANFTADNTSISTGQSVNFTDNSIEGGAVITDWDWEFIGSETPSYSGQTPPAITYNTAGTFEVALTVTNSLGDNTKSIAGYITVSAMGDMFTLDFETSNDYSQNFAPWTNVDVDGDATYGSTDCDFPGEQSAFSFMAFNPSDAGFSLASAHGGQRCGMAVGSSDNLASDNWLISDKIHIGTGSDFKFWVLSPKTGSWGNEIFNVLVSTTNNNIGSFTEIASGEEAPASWTQKTYDLSSYSGQDIYVAVQHVSANKFMFWIDDIEITGATLSTNNINNQEISIFPNPTNGNVTITNVANSNIIISDVNGRVLINKVASSNNFNIDLSKLDEGTYIAKIINDNSISIKKIIVK